MKKPPSTDDIDIPLDMIAGAYPAIANALKTGTTAQRAELRRGAKFYQRQFVEARRAGHQPEGIAAGQHDIADSAVADMLKKASPGTLSCSAGCSHCCYQAVYVTDQEARLMTMAVEEGHIPYDYERAMKQAAWAPIEWNDKPHADRKCGFLGDDGRCMVYDHRPLVCRKYMVSSAPELCDNVKHPGGGITMMTSIATEIITAAAHVATEGGMLPLMMVGMRPMYDERRDS